MVELTFMATQRYTGLPTALRQAVFERDEFRCRWCGATNRGGDIHHIQYRRGYSYDVLDNLITLDRGCHGFVHDSYQIPKETAQEVLSTLISDGGEGRTGLAVWRSLKESKSGSDAAPVTGPVGRLLQLE